MRSSFFQKNLEWVYETFKADTSKMLIATGTMGWILSSAAQLYAIIKNKNIDAETKSFLYPQELMDAIVNIASFLGFTLVAKKGVSKLVSTGKFAPESVRNYLNKSVYKDKVGKLDLNLDEVLKDKSVEKSIFNSYTSYKNIVTTLGTVGASILSCNVITPLIRNKTASRVQKSYIDMKNNPTAYDEPLPNFNKNEIYTKNTPSAYPKNSSGMKI